MSIPEPSPFPAANRRRPVCLPRLGAIGCLKVSAELGSPAPVAEGGRWDH
jgi:hypothetical protein